MNTKEIEEKNCPICGSVHYTEHKELGYESEIDDPQYGGKLIPVIITNCQTCN